MFTGKEHKISRLESCKCSSVWLGFCVKALAVWKMVLTSVRLMCVETRHEIVTDMFNLWTEASPLHFIRPTFRGSANKYFLPINYFCGSKLSLPIRLYPPQPHAGTFMCTRDKLSWPYFSPVYTFTTTKKTRQEIHHFHVFVSVHR